MMFILVSLKLDGYEGTTHHSAQIFCQLPQVQNPPPPPNTPKKKTSVSFRVLSNQVSFRGGTLNTSVFTLWRGGENNFQAPIQDFGQGGQRSFDPRWRGPEPKIKIEVFPLKLPENYMIQKNSWGPGFKGPPGSAIVFKYSKQNALCYYLSTLFLCSLN